MKIKERKITRTITVNHITVKDYNDETDEVSKHMVIVIGEYDEKELTELARKYHAELWDGWTFIKIVENIKQNEKCVMTEEDYYYRSEHTPIEE